MNKLYTFGYTGLKLAVLQAFLEAQNITVIDVRWKPASRNPTWNKGPMQKALGQRYVHISQFGNLNYNGKMGQGIILAAPEEGVEVFRPYFEKGDCALMCVCENWGGCHRRQVATLLTNRLGVLPIHLHRTDIEAAAPAPPPGPTTLSMF